MVKLSTRFVVLLALGGLLSSPGKAVAGTPEENIALAMPPAPGKHTEVAPSPLTATVTAASKRASKDPSPLRWQKLAPKAILTDAVVVNPNKTFQTIDGFGGAFTDSACFVFNRMPAPARKELFHQLFDPSQLNLNVCRTCIGASDYATEAYSYCEGQPDPKMERFSIAHDEKWIIPMIKEARQVNPQMRIFGSPWSPPGWMKSNKSMLGGSMQRKYMSAYAQYFAKFVQAYEKHGVPIASVTVQNEVDTDQDGRMPACAWPQEYECDFVAHELGPTFEREKIKTKIWIIDHNYNMWGRALASMEDPPVRKYVSGIAWHGYMGDPGKMTVVHDAYPNLGMYWTEGGPDINDKNYASDWSKWSSQFTGILRNWSSSVTVWNLALDEAGKPNIGPFSCGGLVTVDSKTNAVTYSGQYWALSQFASHVKRGAVRVDSQGTITGVSHVAFKNPDGSYVAVVTNEGTAPHTINLLLGDHVAKLDLPADSVTTYTWH